MFDRFTDRARKVMSLARKAAQDLRGVDIEAEPLEYFVPNDRCRGRGTRERSRAWQAFDHLADLEVFRSEIVPPLADAMGFVDGYEGAIEVGEQ